jgi:hypothetical protein
MTRVRRSCSSLVAAPPPLAPNTRTVVVNSGTRVRRLLRLRLHSLRTLGQSSSILGLMLSGSRSQFRGSCSSLVAAPPPLAPNTRTVVVNPWASVPRFVASHPVPTVDIE